MMDVYAGESSIHGASEGMADSCAAAYMNAWLCESCLTRLPSQSDTVSLVNSADAHVHKDFLSLESLQEKGAWECCVNAQADLSGHSKLQPVTSG